MKKSICYLVALLCATVLSFTSCSSCSTNDGGNGFGFLYDANAQGDADGNVNFTFPNGTCELEGTAGLLFTYSNDTTQRVANAEVLTVEKLKGCENKQTLQAFDACNEWVDQSFNATVASGTYYVHLKVQVTETLTGLTFEVERTFTNRADSVAVQ